MRKQAVRRVPLRRVRLHAAVVLAGVVATACYSPPVETPQTHVTQETPIRVPQNAQNRVDILFMVDNSLSMDAMQSELRARFGEFLSVFDALPGQKLYPDLHIGVVTSDFGAGDKAKTGGCSATPGGDRGILQTRGAAAPAGCSGPVGARYIAYAYDLAGGATHNLPAGQSLQQTFTCMAAVGSGGCGFEHQLESVHAALHNSVENAGFLRDDAVLAVVFVTNEDDGSAPPTTTIYEDDGGLHGAYDTYRQTRYAIACGGAADLKLPPYGDSGGPLAGCVPAPNTPTNHVGEAYDVSRYIELLTQPPKRGGIKRNPADVIAVAIDGNDLTFDVIQAKNGSGAGLAPNPAYVECPTLGSDCLVRLQHSCQNRVAPAFFADPAIRINAVLDAVPTHDTFSICGGNLDQAPDFSQALQKVALAIRDKISPGCIPALLADAEHPQCVVEDVSTDDAGVDHITEIPRCDLATGHYPCWRVEDKVACATISPQSAGVTIDRGGMPAPPETTARVFCATLAQ